MFVFFFSLTLLLGGHEHKNEWSIKGPEGDTVVHDGRLELEKKIY